jgi:cell division protein FtsZ
MSDVIEPVSGLNRNLYKIRVLGLGGCGNNAINHMVERGLEGPVLIAANTDERDLERCVAPYKLQIGLVSTEGFGCGGDPMVGRKAAEESMPQILSCLDGADIVFLACGLGGGTGTGGVPLVAESLSKLKKPPLVVTVAVMPFEYELNRVATAKAALASLLKYSNSVIAISNEKFGEIDPDASVKKCRAMADDVLYFSVRCITELILRPGVIHIDFADIRSTLSVKGRTIMGIGEGSGADRCVKAVEEAINCPLMLNQSIKGAKVLLVNVVADDDLSMRELSLINETLVAQGAPDVRVFSGLGVDNSLANTGVVRVTVMATGLSYDEEDRKFIQQPSPAGRITIENPDQAGSGQRAELENFQPSNQVSQGLLFQLDAEEPITLFEEPEVNIGYGPEPKAASAQSGYADPLPGPSEVVSPSANYNPPKKRVVRMDPAPLSRLPKY